MISIILKSFKIHKKKSVLNIIQFSIAFFSLLLSICMVQQVLEYRRNIESIMDSDTVQMSVTEDESDDEEDGEVVGKEPPKTQKDKYSTIYDEIKSDTNVSIGILDNISVYDENNMVDNAIMVNKDFINMAKWKFQDGNIEKLVNYNDDDVIPVIVSYSLRDKYKLNEKYNIEYMIDEDTYNATIMVVAVADKNSYIFTGNATCISDTIKNKEDFMVFPKIADFSDLAYENNVLIKANSDMENLEDRLSDEYGNVGKNIQFISLESQIEQYYNKQKTVILATMIFAIIIIVLSLLGTIGTILSNLVLRKREFGIYYAMGLSKKHLLIMTLGEGMVMFFISFVISIAGSLAVTFFMASEGFKITLENVAITLLVMIVCMVVCELLPMRKIAGQEPVELINEGAGE
ncbi:MAG: FtsX-like permease family protein [Eubacterium sp.]|nr:FtsX-like permease family protein [Eubacterium sp.]